MDLAGVAVVHDALAVGIDGGAEHRTQRAVRMVYVVVVDPRPRKPVGLVSAHVARRKQIRRFCAVGIGGGERADFHPVHVHAAPVVVEDDLVICQGRVGEREFRSCAIAAVVTFFASVGI